MRERFRFRGVRSQSAASLRSGWRHGLDDRRAFYLRPCYLEHARAGFSIGWARNVRGMGQVDRDLHAMSHEKAHRAEMWKQTLRCYSAHGALFLHEGHGYRFDCISFFFGKYVLAFVCMQLGFPFEVGNFLLLITTSGILLSVLAWLRGCGMKPS